MNKALLKIIALLLCTAFILCGCAKGNEYGLSFVAGERDATNYIYFDDDSVVYVVGGIMMAEIDGESISLQSALTEGKVALAEILESAKADAEKEIISVKNYDDGSVEYTYDNFRLLILNNTDRYIYFTPLELNYYSFAG